VGGGDTGWHGTPAADAERVYVANATGFAALEAASGRVAWRAALWPVHPPTAGTLRLRGGKLLVHDENTAAALDAASGRLLWTWQGDSTWAAARVGADERTLYAATRDRQIVALDAASGQPRWRAALDGATAAGGWRFGGRTVGTAVSGDTVYAGAIRFLTPNGYGVAGLVVALDARSGRELWRFQTDTTERHDVSGAPAVAGGVVVVSDVVGHGVVGIDRTTGRPAWRLATDTTYAGPTGTPGVAGDTVFVGSNDAAVYAVDAATGRLWWRTAVPASVSEIGVCARRVFANHRGVTVLERPSGRVLATRLQAQEEFTTGGIAVAGGRAFVTTAQGVYAFGC
jgi:outer membrane protein assembly factor BamB